MTIEQVDRETASACRSLSALSRKLAITAMDEGDTKECRRLVEQADWYEEWAERLESRHEKEHTEAC